MKPIKRLILLGFVMISLASTGCAMDDGLQKGLTDGLAAGLAALVRLPMDMIVDHMNGS